MKSLLKPWWGKVITVALFLLLLLALAAGYSLWRINQILPRATTFDAELWYNADTNQRDNPRCLMQRDIKENHLELGMTRAEITALLGEPEANEQTTSYYLGFCHPFGVDAMALGLEFDNNNKLTRTYDIQY